MAVLLDRQTGRPERNVLLGPSGLPTVMEENERRGWQLRGAGVDRLPPNIQEMLARSRDSARVPGALELPFTARNSMQSWEEVLYAIMTDGTQVIASTSETIMVPDFTLPANYLYPGRMLKYTVIGEYSTVITTPGTITFRLRWGGVSGTSLAASGAFAPDPTAANTTLTCMVEWWLCCRATGTAAASIAAGRVEWNDYDDASAATIVGNLNMRMAPVSGMATTNINTTTANALSPTVQFSVTTATTQFTAHIATLEALT